MHSAINDGSRELIPALNRKSFDEDMIGNFKYFIWKILIFKKKYNPLQNPLKNKK